MALPTDLCAVLISGDTTAFTPPVVPVLTSTYFAKGIHRLFLSATMAGTDAFVRAFGREPGRVICPETPAGACERLFVMLPGDIPDAQSSATVEKMTEGHKRLVLTPSHKRAAFWKQFESPGLGDDVEDQLNNFKSASAPATLVLANRYDGIDLPGNTCHLMIVDGLPARVGPFESYFYDRLHMARILRSTIASRVAQSFGRITRGLSDYGVVVLSGNNLLSWLMVPRNRAALSPFLRSQLQIGIDLHERFTSLSSTAEIIQDGLLRSESWMSLYRQRMAGLIDARPALDDNDALKIALVEANFSVHYWNREYKSAAKVLQDGLDATLQISEANGAWHELWLGYCCELMNDHDVAQAHYAFAHNARRDIPPTSWGHALKLRNSRHRSETL